MKGNLMPKRALIERRPWLLGSVVLAVAWAVLQGTRTPELYLFVLHAGALVLLAVYAALRHRGRDTQLLAAMLGLEALGMVLFDFFSPWVLDVMLLAYLAGLVLFLSHRLTAPDITHRIGAGILILATPLVCFLIARGTAFYGLALGGMAAGAWVSNFPQWRVGMGAVLIVAGNVLWLAAIVAIGGNNEVAVWRPRNVRTGSARLRRVHAPPGHGPLRR